MASIFRSLVIILFALCIVMMGARELRKRHAMKGKGSMGPEMISILHGEVDIAKGNVAEQAKTQEERSTERAQYSGDGAIEDLGKEMELKQLLNKLAP